MCVHLHACTPLPLPPLPPCLCVCRDNRQEIANVDATTSENEDSDNGEVYSHDGAKVDNDVSRALRDQEEMPYFVSVGDKGSSKLAKVRRLNVNTNVNSRYQHQH